MMCQYSTYSVISPEGCASILWKSADKAAEAAEAMGLTADRLKELNLIDTIIDEPLGGAHRDPEQMALNIKSALTQTLEHLQGESLDKLLEARYAKLMSFGNFTE